MLPVLSLYGLVHVKIESTTTTWIVTISIKILEVNSGNSILENSK